jgi:hypothetical protein
MNILMDANLEKMKACLEVAETCLWKMEVMIRAGHNQVGDKITIAWKNEFHSQ